MTVQRVVILGGILLALIFFLGFQVHERLKREKIEELEKLSYEIKASQ